MPMSSAQQSSYEQFATHLAARLIEQKAALQEQFSQPDRIPSCYLDQVLDESTARAIAAAFPQTQTMLRLQDLRESKYVTMQIDQVDPVLTAIVYAFQDARVIDAVSQITGQRELLPDTSLYAAGMSIMQQGDFLNPHLDNSHDKDGQRYRTLNLLYYVTPEWQEADGGNLELWDHGLNAPCRTIAYRFNRLVIMATHDSSWHSVSPIVTDRDRYCINTYYFSAQPFGQQPYRHITSFRGRPEQPLRDVLLQADTWLRQRTPRGLKNFIRKPQYYQGQSNR